MTNIFKIKKQSAIMTKLMAHVTYKIYELCTLYVAISAHSKLYLPIEVMQEACIFPIIIDN